jgi:hypothetical protein
MNSLNRDIKKDEIVVLKATSMNPQYRDLKYRLFKVEGGFGMSAKTSGTALFGMFLCDGEETRWEGFEIDKKETELYQAGSLIIDK